MKDFYGNFTVVVKALTYILTLGKEGIPDAAKNAVLNANYMMKRLKEKYHMAYDVTCMHEFVMSLEDLLHETGVSAMDIARVSWTTVFIPHDVLPPHCSRGTDD